MAKETKKPTIAEARLKVVKAIETLKKAERGFIDNFRGKDVKVPYYDGLWLYCKSISSDLGTSSCFRMTFLTNENFPITINFDREQISDLLYEVGDINDQIEEQEQNDEWYRDEDEDEDETDVAEEEIEEQPKPKSVPKKKLAKKKK